MRHSTSVVLLALVTTVSAALAADPGPAIGAARTALGQKQYAQAVKLLQDAIPDATSLADAGQKQKALAAIHFFSALAFNGMNNEAKTKEELEQFFRFSTMNTIDASKFDPQFVRWFNDVQKTLKSESSVGFEAAYPGYRAFAPTDAKVRTLAEWGDGPELTLLGTPDERRKFHDLTTDDERRAFIDAFWKRHDPTPESDANEFRDEFEKRAAFADHLWGSERGRGALSDRGRVFILLGEPVVIRTKPLSQAEGASVQRQGAVVAANDANARNVAASMDASDHRLEQKNYDPVAKGSIERWYFNRDQLPKSIPDAEVVFKFITEEGYGDHILQRDFMINKVLHDASAAVTR